MTDGRPAPLRNRLTDLLGVDYPIVQAPMGYIARAALASAVSNAGAFGIVETSSGRLDEVRDEMLAMRKLTDKPWGVNIAQMFVSNEDIVAFVAGLGVSFVTTSAGDPSRFTEALHDAGITVFHVVPSLRAAAKAVRAGVDGLVVEGGEGGGFKNTKPVATIVLVPQIRREFDLPIIAAGGISDGPAMAAAFALGAATERLWLDRTSGGGKETREKDLVDRGKKSIDDHHRQIKEERRGIASACLHPKEANIRIEENFLPGLGQRLHQAQLFSSLPSWSIFYIVEDR